MVFFRSVAGAGRARRESLLESYRAAQDDLLLRTDVVMGAQSNLRLPGCTGLSVFLGNQSRADRARRALTLHLESLNATR